MVFFASRSPKQSFGTRALRALFRGVVKRRRTCATLTSSEWAGVVEGLEERVMLSGSTADGHVHDDFEHGPHEDHVHPPGVYGTPLSPVEGLENGPPEEGPYPESETFRLNSKPGSNYTIFLDFDGHLVENTRWNGTVSSMDARPYDTDGNPSTFSSAEHDFIQLVWQSVAEDFAPFDVNVTTQDPGVEALRRVGAGDTQWGSRALITYNDFGLCNNSCGGVAYLNAFDFREDEPAWVFNKGNVNVTAQTISHEVGHNLGLVHDGDGNNAYYSGHGTGNTGWGPIMGAPFSKRVSQFSKGDYFAANETSQDDLAKIVATNGFGYRVDDHGSTRTTGSEFTIDSLVNVTAEGVIERTSDIDYFRFETGTGPVSFQISNFSPLPNLDIWAGIYDTNGELVAESNRADDLSASFNSLQLQGGVYYLRVEGIGSHDVYNATTDRVEAPANPPWLVANPEGYNDYGSLGFYSITGSIQASEVDFGDAPDTYGTLEDSNGARHVATGVTLGVLRDFETDGSPSVGANADGADEDGVVFRSPLVAGKKANVTINAPLGGVLDAWIDFNGNGTFDPEEQIFTDTVLVAGLNELTIDVPDTAVAGSSYARFRIADSADHVTGPTGKADTGEVEDYAVTISPSQFISEVFFNPPGTVDTGAEYIELRGTPDSIIAPGTFFVAIDGDSAAGTVEFVYNLGGLSYGSNGYLVLLQKDSVYLSSVDPASNVVVSTEAGWKDFGRKVRLASSSSVNLDNNSGTFMLVQSSVAPQIGNDIDADNNATPDGPIFPGWTVQDSVGLITTANGISYARTTFSTNGGGLIPAGSNLINMGGSVIDYVGRQGASVGSLATDWAGGTLEAGSAAPVNVLGTASPVTLNNRPLDHIGGVNFIQRDYGDAPNSYGTQRDANGASHGIGGPILGTFKDLESNGTPNASATGDNNINDSDEDGVLIPAFLEGKAGNVTITLNNVSGSAVVQGWFDWNGNGVFDNDEMVINQTVTSNGTITIPVTAPIPAFDNTFGSTYARFRVSENGGLAAVGAAVAGEVEDYHVNILTSATDDFGDAPDSYGTSLANNGARHRGVGPVIGAIRDIERDGNPSVDALGDNNHLQNDEDGISYPTPIAPGFTSTIYVDVVGSGYLDAWMDVNQNGTFDAGEQIITNRKVMNGQNVVTFNTPADAKLDYTYIRYRLSSTEGGVTSPVGSASDGEVQDDRVKVLPIFNRPPTVQDNAFSIPENTVNGTVLGSVTASEPDLGQTLTYDIIGGNLNQAFAINPSTGVITVNNQEAVDFELKETFVLRVRVTDSGNPRLSAQATVTVTLIDQNDPVSIGLREESPVGTVVTSVTLPPGISADSYRILSGNTNTTEGIPNAFSVDNIGVVRVASSSAINYETQPIFNLVIEATDSSGPSSVEVVLKVKLIDRDEAPTVNDYEFIIDDDLKPGAVIGTVQASDDDLGSRLSYSLYKGNENGAFALDPISGELTVANPQLLRADQDRVVNLGLLVRDNGEFQFSTDSEITIHLRDQVFFDNFESGTLNPVFWTPGVGVNVKDAGGDKAVVMASDAGTQSRVLTLKVDVGQKDNITLSFDRLISTAGTSGVIQVSNDGTTWKQLQAFSGGSAVLGVEEHHSLNISDALAPGRPSGEVWVRITAQVGGGGLTIDNVGINGLPKAPTPSDVMLYDTANNQWLIGISDGTKFDQIAAPWIAGSDWTFLQGDFNGDGMTDVAGMNSLGDWHVGVSTGTGLSVSMWLDWAPPSMVGWQDFQVGDFNGDGKDDIAARNNGGYWYIASSLGTSFTEIYGGRWSTIGWDNFVVGDFNGDGKDDIAADRSATGDWWVNFGTGSRFSIQHFGRWSGTREWVDVVAGDFNGDGRDDIAGRQLGTGQWWVGVSTGSNFSLVYGTRWSSTLTWMNVVVGDFDGDGKDDILGRHSGGEWYLNNSFGSRFQINYYGRWLNNTDYTTVVGDFNLDGKADVAGFSQGTGNWVVGTGDGLSLFRSDGSIMKRLGTSIFANWGPINAQGIGSGQLD